MSALEAALISHRYALQLDPENTDTLFNTSQVLTAIAEEIEKTNGRSEDAIKALQEAIQIQDQCLLLQESKYAENLKQQALMEEELANQSDVAEDEAGKDYTGSGSASAQTEDQYFAVEEQVTHETLIDTALAELSTLTTLCSILNSSAAYSNGILSSIETISSALLDDKIPAFAVDQPSKWQEIALARANMLSALLEAAFKSKKIDAQRYRKELDAIFAASELDISSNFSALSAYAQALIAYSYAIAEDEELDAQNRASRIWNSLSFASSRLATASKLSHISNDEAYTPHFLQADCALLQHALGQPPTSYAPATSNAALLLKNAKVFYKNASKLSQDLDQRQIAAFRSWVVAAWEEKAWPRVNSSFENKGVDWVQQQLVDMQSEGLLAGFGEP